MMVIVKISVYEVEGRRVLVSVHVREREGGGREDLWSCAHI